MFSILKSLIIDSNSFPHQEFVCNLNTFAYIRFDGNNWFYMDDLMLIIDAKSIKKGQIMVTIINLLSLTNMGLTIMRKS